MVVLPVSVWVFLYRRPNSGKKSERSTGKPLRVSRCVETVGKMRWPHEITVVSDPGLSMYLHNNKS